MLVLDRLLDATERHKLMSTTDSVTLHKLQLNAVLEKYVDIRGESWREFLGRILSVAQYTNLYRILRGKVKLNEGNMSKIIISTLG